MTAAKKINRDNYLFREGDPPDSMYVIKTGKLAVVKTKSTSEIVLAELGPGTMVGEMAFFDEQPRSASVKALKDTEVISLPYKALHAQFANFPEWAKAIMRQVSKNLRQANARIKQLESTSGADEELFPPHTITKLISILNLIGHKYGKATEEGLAVAGGLLRNYTIQVFQEPTHKMQKLMVALSELGFMRVDELGEGRQKIILLKPDLLFEFVEWYNDWLFKQEKDRVSLREEELQSLNGLLHFASKLEKNDKGQVKINLTDVQNDSMREVGFLIKVDDFNGLIEKKIIGDKMMAEGGIFVTLQMEEVQKIAPFWGIIYGLKKAIR